MKSKNAPEKPSSLGSGSSSAGSVYENFFNLSEDMMGIANLEGYFEHVNPKFVRTLGYSEKDLIAHPFISYVHPNDVDATNREVEKLAQGQRTINFVNRYRKSDGEYISLQWSSTPHDGKLYAIARDITNTIDAEQKMESTIAELARLNQLMVNRELKMVELKEEIARLKAGKK